jgi:hypothetical protein
MNKHMNILTNTEGGIYRIKYIIERSIIVRQSTAEIGFKTSHFEQDILWRQLRWSHQDSLMYVIQYISLNTFIRKVN